MPFIDLTKKTADWKECPHCAGEGCKKCGWHGSVLVSRIRR